MGIRTLLGLLISFTAAQAAPHLQPRYVGFVSYEQLGRSQFAKVDFVGSSHAKGPGLKAIFTLHFGSFRDSEYLSYHFDSVHLDSSSGTFTFDQPNQDVTITHVRLESDGALTGTLHHNHLMQAGEFRLVPAGRHLTVPNKLIESLHGEYAGVCHGKPYLMQLATFRTTEDTTRVGNPFGHYEIRGQAATSEQDAHIPPVTLAQQQELRVLTNFSGGSYHFLMGELEIAGFPENTRCLVEGNTLTCNGHCVLTKIDSRPLTAADFELPKHRDHYHVTRHHSAKKDELGGTYRGYLHHEFLDRYQSLSLNIIDYPRASGPRRISATASLYFGTPGVTPEILSYKFDPQEYREGQPQFIFSRILGDVDAIVHVTSHSKGVIRGYWFSMLFGRVGSFEVRKEGLSPVPLPPHSRVMNRLSGIYDSDLWELDVAVFPGRSPNNSDNPFYPLEIKGSLKLLEGGAKVPLEGGSYDFYTDRLGILYPEDRALTGFRGDPHLNLRMMSAGYGAKLLPYKPSEFKLRVVR